MVQILGYGFSSKATIVTSSKFRGLLSYFAKAKFFLQPNFYILTRFPYLFE